MVAVIHHKNEQRPVRALPFAGGANGRANGKKTGNGQRKPIMLVPPDIHSSRSAALAEISPSVELESKINSAIADDGDPAKLLSDVRDALFGPTRKLQEARLEELVQILEGLDRESQATDAMFAEQFQQLNGTAQQHAQVMAATNQMVEDNAKIFADELAVANKRIEDATDVLASQIRTVATTQTAALDEQAVAFETKLAELTTLVAKQFEDMATHHRQTMQAMATEFSEQLRDLAALSKNTDEQIMAQMDARFEQAEATSDEEKLRKIKVLSEGFNTLSDRLLAL